MGSLCVIYCNDYYVSHGFALGLAVLRLYFCENLVASFGIYTMSVLTGIYIWYLSDVLEIV